MSFYIGLDGGGTKTEAVVFDETGHIFLRDVTRGCVAMDVGPEHTIAHLTDVLHRTSESIPGGIPRSVYVAQSSMRYYGALMLPELNRVFAGWNIRWEDGGLAIITSMIGRKDGCCAVAGTGSCLFARVGGKIHHIGGYGYLVDTVGSGYILGQDALRAAFAALDGRGEKTVLYDLIRMQMRKAPEENIPAIYSGGRAYIASFARTVFEGVRAGDAVSKSIMLRGAEAIARYTYAAEPYFDSDFDVVMSGGIMLNYPEYAQAVTERASKRAHMIRANVPPILGSALDAVWNAKDEPAPDFRERFINEYLILKASQGK